ncbi:hypothetical protein Taro_043899 [Colocasia esculenta]|uniref:Uncharacterized protein n=1 Tax=Colocasia esculenta TaxID=4460 RepID=A0A843WM94_COLES|nr:hypothetical protein [Colocasia esculenta]
MELRHHVTEEHVIEEDEEDEIDSQDDIDDNENMEEGDDEPLFDIVRIWHRRTDYIIPPDEETIDIGRVEYMAWYWSITRRYIGRSGFTYDMRYEPRDHIERSLVEGMKYLHMMATDGLQDDISDSTQSRFIAMQMYIDGVLSHVQRTDSSTSHAGPSEPCTDTPQQPDDAGPSHFSPNVMTVSQYGLYDVGASQILTDEGMTDTQPPQSTVGTYRRQRRHRGSTSTLPQQSQSDLLGETLGSIDEDMDSETAQSESCDAILVHETQSQSETESTELGENTDRAGASVFSHSTDRPHSVKTQSAAWKSAMVLPTLKPAFPMPTLESALATPALKSVLPMPALKQAFPMPTSITHPISQSPSCLRGNLNHKYVFGHGFIFMVQPLGGRLAHHLWLVTKGHEFDSLGDRGVELGSHAWMKVLAETFQFRTGLI